MNNEGSPRKNRFIRKIFLSIFAISTFAISILLFINSLYTSKQIEAQETHKVLLTKKDKTTNAFDFLETELVSTRRKKISKLEKVLFDVKVQKAETMFRKYGGYLSGYGPLIVRATDQCGGDYRYILAIAGNESGFGRINYKLYNPFGYLDGVQYASYAQALPHLICNISKQYLIPCNLDLDCIVVHYAGPTSNKPRWVSNIQSFVNQIDRL